MVHGDIEIRRLKNAQDADVISLVAQSDEYLNSLYPPESNHAESLETLMGENSAFFVAYLGDQLVACGAVKLMQDKTPYGEIKRVFVAEEHRGKRLATKLMQHLEEYLLGIGISKVRLEAGPLQPEAIELYRKTGYRLCGPFGAYKEDPLSIFMEKDLLGPLAAKCQLL